MDLNIVSFQVDVLTRQAALSEVLQQRIMEQEDVLQQLQTELEQAEETRVGCSGWQWVAVDGMGCSGWQWVAVDGMGCSGWQWVAVDGMGCSGWNWL